VPIFNLKSDRNIIDFSQFIGSLGKIVLRAITDEEQTSLTSIIGGYASDRILPIYRSDFILEIKYYDKFYSQGENLDEKIKAQVDELITALRLLKKGYVGASIILLRHPLMDKTTNLIYMNYDLFSLAPSVNQGKIPYPNPFLLNEDEVNAVHNILQLLKQVINKKNDLPIRRFNTAYEKTKKADKFLDLMITYEALFSGKGSDSVNHKLVWDSQDFLGNDSTQCKDLYDKMKKLYGIRNLLVHGDNDDVDNTSVEQTEDYMRRSIRGYLHEMHNNSFTKNDEFTEYLDFVKTFG
jgi:hypothetical protein